MDAGEGVSLGRLMYLGSFDLGGAREPAEEGGWEEGGEAGSDGRAAGGRPTEKPGMNGRGAEGTGGGGEESGRKALSGRKAGMGGEPRLGDSDSETETE